jgi:HEAT repeat protein
VLILRAVANAGYAPALAYVKPHLRSSDATIRAAAVASLRSMQTGDAAAVLAERLTNERSPDVRISALDAARVRGPSDQLERALVAASNDPGPRVRHRAVELMIEWLPERPRLREQLARIASRDPEAGIRERASAAL